ncbi:hypothetical protein OROGR_016682 [Orobanche gracilis]
MADWANLPRDLIRVISKRLNTSIETITLRSVCSSWRDSIPSFFNYYKRDTPSGVERYILDENWVYIVQDLTPGSSSCWLIRLEKTREGNFRPMNPLCLNYTYGRMPRDFPFTMFERGEKIYQPAIEFPKSLDLTRCKITEIAKVHSLDLIKTGPNGDMFIDMGKIGLDVIHKVIVSSEPFVNSLTHGALMIYGKGRLGFLNLQDSTWKFYPELDDSWCFTDLMYHKGKFYAVDTAVDNKMARFVEIGPDLVVKEAADLLYKDEAPCFCYRLVKSTDDNVFLIGDVAIVLKLNEEKSWEKVISLDGHIFFTGKDCSYAVRAAEFPGLKAYFGGTIMSSDLIYREQI